MPFAKERCFLIPRYPEGWLDELRSRSDIVAVLGKYMYLQKKGAKFWACCPFHKEKTPSFVVNPEEQYYHCFGCGVSGNVITFLMEHEHMTYPEAVETLAKQAGMEMPEEESPEERKRREASQKILEANRSAARYYYSSLKGAPEAVTEYISKRRISHATAVAFGLGYSPDRYGLKRALNAKGFSDSTLKDAGLVNAGGGDIMESRLIIPIINIKGNVLGFGGRTLSDEIKPKYVNTRGTMVFDKRKNLFGINLLKKHLSEEKITSVVLTEGYMDVISLYQAGIHNAVASMGTSLTDEQCREIKRLVGTVYVCFDGDAAGENATWRSLDMLQGVGVEVAVMSLPDDMDPDDVVKTRGADGFRDLMREALPLTEFKIRRLAQSEDLETFAGRENFAIKTLPVLNALSPIGRDTHIKLVSELSGLSAESINNSLKDYAAGTAKTTRVEKERNDESGEVPKPQLRTERFLLKLFLDGAEYASVGDFGADAFLLPVHRRIFEAIKADPKLKIGDLFDMEPDARAEIEAVVSATDGMGRETAEEYYEAILKKYFAALRKERIAAVTAKLKAAAGAEKEALEAELLKLLKNDK